MISRTHIYLIPIFLLVILLYKYNISSKEKKTAFVLTVIIAVISELFSRGIILFCFYYTGIPAGIYNNLMRLIVNIIVVGNYILIDYLINHVKNKTKYSRNQKQYRDEYREYRHDLANQLAPLYLKANDNDTEAVKKYLEEFLNIGENDKAKSDSGNKTVDDIVNFYIRKIPKDAKIHLDVKVPCDLNINERDFSVVIGNLIDNSIEAVNKIKNNDKFISISIVYSKDVITISIRNCFSDIIKYDEDSIMTTKMDMENHGIGIKSVRRILKKYNGMIKIETADGVFTVKAIMYIDK